MLERRLGLAEARYVLAPTEAPHRSPDAGASFLRGFRVMPEAGIDLRPSDYDSSPIWLNHREIAARWTRRWTQSHPGHTPSRVSAGVAARLGLVDQQGDQVVAPGSTERGVLVEENHRRLWKDADVEQPDDVAAGVGGPSSSHRERMPGRTSRWGRGSLGHTQDDHQTFDRGRRCARGRGRPHAHGRGARVSSGAGVGSGQWRRRLIKGAAAQRPAARSSDCSDSSNSAASGRPKRGADTAAFGEEQWSRPTRVPLVRGGSRRRGGAPFKTGLAALKQHPLISHAERH
jgi:hypothetical protein